MMWSLQPNHNPIGVLKGLICGLYLHFSWATKYPDSPEQVTCSIHHWAKAGNFDRKVNLWRITRSRDPVPHVPPLPIYHHVGSEAYFEKDAMRLGRDQGGFQLGLGGYKSCRCLANDVIQEPSALPCLSTQGACVVPKLRRPELQLGLFKDAPCVLSHVSCQLWHLWSLVAYGPRGGSFRRRELESKVVRLCLLKSTRSTITS